MNHHFHLMETSEKSLMAEAKMLSCEQLCNLAMQKIASPPDVQIDIRGYPKFPGQAPDCLHDSSSTDLALDGKYSRNEQHASRPFETHNALQGQQIRSCLRPCGLTSSIGLGATSATGALDFHIQYCNLRKGFRCFSYQMKGEDIVTPHQSDGDLNNDALLRKAVFNHYRRQTVPATLRIESVIENIDTQDIERKLRFNISEAGYSGSKIIIEFSPLSQRIDIANTGHVVEQGSTTENTPTGNTPTGNTPTGVVARFVAMIKAVYCWFLNRFIDTNADIRVVWHPIYTPEPAESRRIWADGTTSVKEPDDVLNLNQTARGIGYRAERGFHGKVTAYQEPMSAERTMQIELVRKRLAARHAIVFD